MQFREIILETSSIQRTKLFYHKTLELDIVRETEDVVSFKAGKTTLTFKKAKGDSKPYYHFAFNIVNNKFSDSYEWINSKLDIIPGEDGVPVVGYNNWNAQSFYFYDNNGSILEFIVRFDLPYHSSESFSPECITEISEIGLVADDIPAMAENLRTEYKVPYFSYGPKLPDFIAMGDNYGLILLSNSKRKWVPTNKPAKHFPVTIITEDGQQIVS